MISSDSPRKMSQEILISARSDVPVRDAEVCKSERSLKSDLLLANLILQFSSVSLDRSSRATFQTIEMCFLYNTGCLPPTIHSFSIRKKTCMRGRSKFRSFLLKTIVKVQSAWLKLSEVIALLTAHLLISTLLSKFTRRSTNFLLEKLHSAMMFACERTN